MHLYSIGDFLIIVCSLFDWITYLLWSIYDPATDTRISPCALNDHICNEDFIDTDYFTQRSCLLMPYYCELITMATLAVLSCLFVIVTTNVVFGIIQCVISKEKKHDHTE